MNQDDQIDFLNSIVKVHIAPSSVHGVGVFAIRDIAAGEKLNADRVPEVFRLSPGNLSKLFPEVREQIVSRWPRVMEGMPFAVPDASFLAYMNHSDDPNYSTETDQALRDIKAGEELFEDYRLIPCHQEAYPWLAV